MTSPSAVRVYAEQTSYNVRIAIENNRKETAQVHVSLRLWFGKREPVVQERTINATPGTVTRETFTGTTLAPLRATAAAKAARW